MAAKSAAKPAAKKAAPKAARVRKAKEPADVETFDIKVGDAHAVLVVNGTEYRLDPDQVHALRRRLNVVFVELH